MTDKVQQGKKWGWMVVLGVAFVNMVNQSLFSVAGLVFGKELKDLAGGTAIGITLVMSIRACVSNFSGLLIGPLMKRMSFRSVTVLGILSIGSGMILSSFATKIWHIAVGFGVITGLGLGFVQSSSFLVIDDYFTQRKGTAVGLAMAGTSVGQMAMPIIVGILLKEFHYSGTTFILGFVSYSGLLGVLLFKPLFHCKKKQKHEAKSDKSKHDSNSVEICELHKEKDNLLENTHIRPVQDTKTKSKPTSIFSKVTTFLDLPLLSDWKFIHIILGLGLGSLCTVTFSAFFPMFLREEVEFTMWQTTSCMTALSAGDITGRLTISEICRKMKLGSRGSFMAGAVLISFTRSFLSEMSSYPHILVASILTGYARAATVINQNLAVSEYVSKEMLPSAVGLNMVAKGILVLALSQPIGLLKDNFNYSTCIHLLDIIMMAVVYSWSIEMLLSKRKNKLDRSESIGS